MSDAGLKGATVYHNLTPSQLYEKALSHEPGTHIMCNGALATLSGTGLLLLTVCKPPCLPLMQQTACLMMFAGCCRLSPVRAGLGQAPVLLLPRRDRPCTLLTARLCVLCALRC